MKYKLTFYLLLLFVVSSCTSPQINDTLQINAGKLNIGLNTCGEIIQLADKYSGENHLHPDSSSYLIHMRFPEGILHPESLIYNDKEGLLYFMFPGERKVTIRINQGTGYISFELINIQGNDAPDLVIWGPVYTSIGKTIGETVGVVRNGDFAIGIQALNIKTLGGYPWLDNDVMPEMDYFDQENYADLKKGGIAHTLYRIEAARPVKGGSVLHAYSRRRYDDRSIDNWGYDNYFVKAFDDNGLIGSSIAIFGCREEDVLPTIAQIEIEQELPHPEINGVWSKLSPQASSAYMILNFNEKDVDKALAYTEKAGLKYLYHSDPFESWGHFKLKNNFFPEGRESLKNCVQKAEERGIHIGLHTLSNFITTNDPYVTPLPDKRLAEVGFAKITKSISSADKEIHIDDPARFNQFKNNYLKAVRIDDELIQYAAVSETKPWKLLDCRRGAFGTSRSSHKSGDTIYKLADHAYKVLLSNPDLTVEIAENIADLYNETGVRQISFDGLEGCRSTGLGNYGEILFTSTWYHALEKNIRSHYIADASRSSHYFWHIFTRMNWGEPWYAGFRESQTEYRLKNQKYFDRNYIPNMLGWFLMRPETSIEDIEWLLARSAAFNAGYAFVSSYETLEKNGATDEILDAIALWENARINDVFSNEQRELMEDVRNEFHLYKSEDGNLLLKRIHAFRLEHKDQARQPGDPPSSSLKILNPGKEQVISFIITARKGRIINPTIELSSSYPLTIPVKLESGQHLKFDGKFVHVFDRNWNELKSIVINTELMKCVTGPHEIRASCKFQGDEASMMIEVRINGELYEINLQ